jgi:uncharacterized NAD(P)/FAD-binding protein YdhS
MTKIAIVGAGFSGTLLGLHLLRKCPPSVSVTLIERAVQFGRGAAYATGNPNHLLNVPAGRMSAFQDKPGDFLNWLEKRPDTGMASVAENSFAPRKHFGAYVRHLLNLELKNREQNARLALVRGSVTSIALSGDGLQIHLDRRRSVSADMAVLAVGNFPPESPTVKDPSFYESDLYRPHPWAPDVFDGLDRDNPVVLIGTGLTMVDTLISLIDRGHRGAIHAVSRRGLIPRRHAASGVLSVPLKTVPTSLTELSRLIRARADEASSAGPGWQAVVDELRPFTLDVWGAMSADDRRRFLRHLRPWWEIHRHRMAGEVADRLDRALSSGQLSVFAGRIQQFRREGGLVEVVYRVRGADQIRTLTAARVINCSGPGCDYSRIEDPLIKSLLAGGVVRPDPLSLGLDVTTSCALRDRRGAISSKLFAVGPVTKGAFWEMTAVPDIRRQCEFLAGHLSALISSGALSGASASVGVSLPVG